MKNHNLSVSSADKFLFTNLAAATGPIPFTMTNDYMFRAVLQKNNKVLKGLIASLLHLEEHEIATVEITNPIQLGETLSSKEFRLDIDVNLNNNKNINLEMQVANLGNWTNRSLSYLCRSFDQLTKGENYNAVKSVIHIGILDFTLFPEHTEFYASYKMLNTKKHYIFNDNFSLYVLDLNYIDLATEEDKKYRIDYWAKLFKAQTWEELKALTTNNDCILEATKTIFQLSTDDQIRKRCRDREDFYADVKKMYDDIAQLQNDNAQLQNDIASKDAEIASKDADNARLQADIASKDADNAQLQAKIASLEAILNSLQK